MDRIGKDEKCGDLEPNQWCGYRSKWSDMSVYEMNAGQMSKIAWIGTEALISDQRQANGNEFIEWVTTKRDREGLIEDDNDRRVSLFFHISLFFVFGQNVTQFQIVTKI